MTFEDLAHKLGIPQDIIDKAQKLGLDAEELGKACVDHTKEAARHWLELWESKLGR